MTLRLYNTLTRTIEPLSPLKPGAVSMYVCGPTVYDEPHIGHARSAYVFDVLRRYLESQGLRVTFVRNVTDVDDKIIEKARQDMQQAASGEQQADLKRACEEVATRYLNSYHEAMATLGIQPPTIEPKATEHVVPEMTDLIAKLLMQGAAYEAGGPASAGGSGAGRDVYFAVRKWERYGVLSNRTVDELQTGARVEPGERKRDPLDFALWKAAKPEEPSWDSPWGRGRPGWHMECSAMSIKYLGEAFDIHGGGLDLIFPHHENEIAQAQAAGKPFAAYWIHHGLLTVKGEKMSKSLGNFITLDQVLKTYPHPDYLKLFFLKTHYRSPIDYSPERMEEAKKNWHNFTDFIRHSEQTSDNTASAAVQNFEERFREAMDEDLNTPKALSVLFAALSSGQQAIASGGREGLARSRHAAMTILECGMMLGLFKQGISDESPESRDKVQALVSQRNELRGSKKFKEADVIREQLRGEGYHLMDTPYGTLWQRIK